MQCIALGTATGRLCGDSLTAAAAHAAICVVGALFGAAVALVQFRDTRTSKWSMLILFPVLLGLGSGPPTDIRRLIKYSLCYLSLLILTRWLFRFFAKGRNRGARSHETRGDAGSD
jgi:hypothetical protein